MRVAITLLVVVALVVLAVPASRAAGSVSGYVYRDLNNDGVRDATEPGIRGVVLRAGKRTAITDATGFYLFPDITTTVSLRADAGWFRTQCTAAYSGPSSGDGYTAQCPDPGAGAGPDQQFRVSNQLLTATAVPGTLTSLGLTPDWPGAGYDDYTTDPALANAVDPALRISPGYRLPGADVDCQRHVCRPDETDWALTQWLNQGTKPLKRLTAVITAPAGTTITHVRPYYGYRAGSGHSVTGYLVKDATTAETLTTDGLGALSHPTSRIKVRLLGRLVPGGEYLTAVAYRMDGDAPFSDGNGDGLPDCDASTGSAYPGQTCSKATDSSPGSYITYGSVVRMRPKPDVDASFCPRIPERCAVFGVHNKTLGGDSNDSAAWKVDSPFPPTQP